MRISCRSFAAALALPVTLVAPPLPTFAGIIGRMTPAEPITEARIAGLPAAEHQPWLDYLTRSRDLLAADKASLAAERRSLKTMPTTGPEHGSTRSMPLDRPAGWYRSDEARRIVANILSYQTPAGGWGKNQDRTAPRRAQGQSYVPIEKLPAYAREDIQTLDEGWRYVGTIDNGATLTELRFLARMQAAAPGAEGDRYRAAFMKGFDYLLAAQFPNGGWPQVYPLQGGYHDAITYNDSAVSQVAMLMLEIARRDVPYAFISPQVAASARTAARRATQLVLDTQVIVDGKRTLWGQQHDALTLKPVGARNFEPAALSTDESADLLIFLMKQPDRTPAVEAAVDNAVVWLQAHALRDAEWRAPNAPEGRRLIARLGAGPLWSRFYDIGTGKPVFGDRDRSIHDDVNEISLERRNGYSWFNTSPTRVIDRHAEWRAARPYPPRLAARPGGVTK